MYPSALCCLPSTVTAGATAQAAAASSLFGLIWPSLRFSFYRFYFFRFRILRRLLILSTGAKDFKHRVSHRVNVSANFSVWLVGMPWSSQVLVWYCGDEQLDVNIRPLTLPIHWWLWMRAVNYTYALGQMM